jgi:hypothetical protein
MHKRFNRVVLRAESLQRGNIHIAVWPFALDDIYSMESYMRKVRDETLKLPEWLRPLAQQLWDEIPGLKMLSFSNAQIVIQHAKVFEDSEILQVAAPLIEPVLRANLGPEEPMDEPSENDGAFDDEPMLIGAERE